MSTAKVLKMDQTTQESCDGMSSIGVVKGLQPSDVVQLLTTTGVRHIVQEDGWDFQNELEAAKAMIEKPKEIIEDPLKVILGRQEGRTGRTLLVTSQAHEKKSKTLFEFDLFLTSLVGTKTIYDQAIMIADELYTNAAKNLKPPNANTNAKANAKPNARSRRGKVEFFAEASGGRLVIGCRDSFGQLEIGTLIGRLNEVYTRGVANAMHHGPGGAGIGTFMVFDAAISYYAGVSKGKGTVICAVLPLSTTRKDAEGLVKNIHFLEFKDNEGRK